VALAWPFRRRRRVLPLVSLATLNPADRFANEAAIRALCLVAPAGPDANLCRVLGRYKLYVDPHDDGLAPHLMLDGYWEMWVTEALAELIRPGMVVADVGANVGYFSVLMADLVGPTGRVIAFEPNPAVAALLARGITANGFAERATLVPDPLGGKEGAPVSLVVPPGDPKNAHVVPGEGGALTTRRLDGDRDWSAIELVKIDVEGAEEAVWTGMEGLLAGTTLRTVLLEFTPIRYADPGAFLDRLLAPGFTLGRIDPIRGIESVTAAEVLAGDPHLDQMLVLRR
jgi:FkbM family methyltransferase